MEKTIKVFNSFTEADEADKRFYRSLSPKQRMEILLTLIAQRQIAQAHETTEGFKRVYRITKLS